MGMRVDFIGHTMGRPTGMANADIAGQRLLFQPGLKIKQLTFGPAALNAANEEAVAAFLAGDIGFLDIGDLNRRVLDDCKAEELSDLDLVLAEDDRARRQAREWVASRQ